HRPGADRRVPAGGRRLDRRRLDVPAPDPARLEREPRAQDHAVRGRALCGADGRRGRRAQPAGRGARHRHRHRRAPGVLVEHLRDDHRPLPAPRRGHYRRHGRHGRRDRRHHDCPGNRLDAGADRQLLADRDLRRPRLLARRHRDPPARAAHGACPHMTLTFSTTRRQALAGLAATTLAACTANGTGGSLAGGSAALPTPSLDALARRKGRRWGTAVAWNPGTTGGSIQNPDYTAIVRHECGIVVPENEMKWQATRPGPDSFDFTRMDAIAAWARTNNLVLRGHTLLWHRPQWFPGWLNNYDYGANPASEAERLLTTHIRTVIDR